MVQGIESSGDVSFTSQKRKTPSVGEVDQSQQRHAAVKGLTTLHGTQLPTTDSRKSPLHAAKHHLCEQLASGWRQNNGPQVFGFLGFLRFGEEGRLSFIPRGWHRNNPGPN